MGSDERDPWRHPFERLFRTCLLVLGSAIALDMAVGYIRAILPWLIGAAVLVTVIWTIAAVVRWRRSRW